MTKKTKVEGKIKNSAKESPIDVIIKDQDQIEEDLHVKTVEAESNTNLEADKGDGQAMTLRFFEFKTNPEMMKKPFPKPQDLFNAHVKQIEFELWKDEWQPVPEVAPRLMFAKDKSHYRIVIAAKPAKGSFFSGTPQTLSEISTPNVSSSNS